MKTLILTIDPQGKPEWAIRAKNKQLADWIEQNKCLPVDNLVIVPAPGETKLYWLEGEEKDIKTLEEIRDKIKPVLGISFE